MKIVTTEQMRQAEQECAKIGIPTDMLMENAGRAVAEEVARIAGTVRQQRILVLIGPGNNGGDGLVAARYLYDKGADVNVYLMSQRSSDDANLKRVREHGIPCVEITNDGNMSQLGMWLDSVTVVIDALFGTGKSRPLGDIFAQALNKVNRAKEANPHLRVMALDLPSGLNADTGAIDPASLYADNTITLGFPKPGLFNPPGAEPAGQITVVDIGIPASLVESVTSELITDDWARTVLPKRPLLANKGSFGRVLVVAGSINYIGAAYLACSGAVRVGTGLVTLSTGSTLQPILAAKLTEVTYLPLLEVSTGIISSEAVRDIQAKLKDYEVMLIGCGMGQSPSVVRFIKSTIVRARADSVPLVVDADGLNTLAQSRNWWQRWRSDAILTPHPGEMSRLTGIPVAEVQADRAGVATKMAAEWHKTIVLKGAYTVVASPDGRCRISPFANPGLASAGTGDVLAGVIAGLVAQGLSLFDAAACGVHLHGKAGEMVKDKLGDAGTTASDLLPELPLVIKQLKES